MVAARVMRTRVAITRLRQREEFARHLLDVFVAHRPEDENVRRSRVFLEIGGEGLGPRGVVGAVEQEGRAAFEAFQAARPLPLGSWPKPPG